jgi:hypothetical protein
MHMHGGKVARQAGDIVACTGAEPTEPARAMAPPKAATHTRVYI